MSTSDFNPRARFEAFLNARWYGRAGVLWLLWPLEWLYIKISERKKKQALALANARREPRLPTLVVGNLVAGGTGKTPVVIELVAQLKALGAVPGIVTRGYGGRSSSWPLVVTPDSDPQICGDEAVELSLATGCTVIAGPDRCASVKWLAENGDCTHVVSDDGLQHYAMAREVEIVLIDAQRRFGNGRRLPVGPLREPASRLSSSDLVLLTARTSEEADAAKRHMQTQAQSENGPVQVPVIGGALMPSSAQALFSEQLVPASTAPFANSSCIALTGIGSPERFQKDLQALGCLVEAKFFADHQDYSQLVSSGALVGWLRNSWVVTTGKDAVKLRALLRKLGQESQPGVDEPEAYERLWVLQRRVAFADAEQSVLTELLSEFVSTSARATKTGTDIAQGRSTSDI